LLGLQTHGTAQIVRSVHPTPHFARSDELAHLGKEIIGPNLPERWMNCIGSTLSASTEDIRFFTTGSSFLVSNVGRGHTVRMSLDLIWYLLRDAHVSPSLCPVASGLDPIELINIGHRKWNMKTVTKVC
jgi:hypothetical protein